MEITYEEYKQECLDDIHLEAQIDGTTYDDYFLTDTLGKLVAMGELIDPQPLCVNKKGRNGIRLTGFTNSENLKEYLKTWTGNIELKDEEMLPGFNDEFIFENGKCTSIIFTNT